MQKITLLCLFTLSSFIAYSQGKSEYSDFNIPTKEDKPFYEKVDSIAKTKDEIYAAVRKSFAEVFVSSNAVIQLDDKLKGQVVGRSEATINHTIGLGIHENEMAYYNINVECKDNKFRIQLYDFYVKMYFQKDFSAIENVRTIAKNIRVKFFPAFDTYMQEVLKRLDEKIKSNTSTSNF